MPHFLCEDEDVIASRHRENMREAIMDTIRALGRPVRCIDVANRHNLSVVSVGKALEYFVPMTFRLLEAHYAKSGEYKSTQGAHFIGLHPHLAHHEPSYNPFGHLMADNTES